MMTLVLSTFILFGCIEAWQRTVAVVIRNRMGPQSMPTGWKPSGLFSLVYVVGTGICLSTLLAFIALVSTRSYGANMWFAFMTSLVMQLLFALYKFLAADLLAVLTAVIAMVCYIIQFRIPELVPTFLFSLNEAMKR